MELNWLPIAISFVTGNVTGLVVKYYGDKWTDRRKRLELESDLKQKFQSANRAIPSLIVKIREALKENSCTREFILVDNIWDEGGDSTGRPWLFCAEPEDILARMVILENLGFVSNLSNAYQNKYRMTEEFAALIQSSK
jgi:hypothetical protein